LFQFGDVKTAFFQDQTLHFQVTANSLNGFPFASSSLMLIEAEDKNGQRQTIYDSDAGGAADGWSLTLAEDPANANDGTVSHRHQFQYVAAPGVFGDVERNQPVNSTIVVAVRVEFDNPVGPGSGSGERRRSVVTREHRLQPRQVVSNVRAAEASAAFVVEGVENDAAELDSAPDATRAVAADIDFDLDADDSSASALTLSLTLMIAVASLLM
jgi:hypothetical protein